MRGDATTIGLHVYLKNEAKRSISLQKKVPIRAAMKAGGQQCVSLVVRREPRRTALPGAIVAVAHPHVRALSPRPASHPKGRGSLSEEGKGAVEGWASRCGAGESGAARNCPQSKSGPRRRVDTEGAAVALCVAAQSLRLPSPLAGASANPAICVTSARECMRLGGSGAVKSFARLKRNS